MTQNEAVLAFMRRNGSITQLEATRELGILRLAARVHDLRAAGHSIHDESVRVPRRHGEMTRVTRYTLTTPPPLSASDESVEAKAEGHRAPVRDGGSGLLFETPPSRDAFERTGRAVR